MRHILIVSPGFSYGGSTTALLSILHSDIIKEHRIDLFSIAKGDNDSPTLKKHDIGLNGLTKAFYSDYSTLSSKEKLGALLMKILKRLPGFGKKVEKWVVNKTVNKLNNRNYDCVVAFQEKRATDFCQDIHAVNRIAWIHCDYAKTYPRTDADLDVYKKYSKIVCVSNATRTSFLTYYPQLAERTTVIYNLFDSLLILQKSKEPLNDEQFNRESISIISVGRLNRVKRFDLIPHIARQVREKVSNVKWYIIGQPYSYEEVKKLDIAIDNEGVRDTVVYLGGRSNPYPYFRAASLLVCVSASEACPMIFNEAKLLNLKIATTDFPSAYEFIKDDNDGRITTIENMSDTISDMILDTTCEEVRQTCFNADVLNESIILQLTQLFDTA